uniref:Lysozyme g n=1 Tax=Takifugu rubripes TaxID=31033 RepID=H2S8G5_TAKRU
MPYGKIEDIKTSGASDVTAAQDGLKEGGWKSSHRMAEIDKNRMENYRTIINEAGRQCDVAPAVIAGIISRESRAGNQLINGWGDHGKAFGLMQIDVTPPPNGGGHTPVGTWDSLEHLIQATEILVEFIERIKTKFPRWNADQHLKGALAAYNKGEKNVESYASVDAKTTGKDYSNDVVARAQWYKSNMGF